MPLSSPFKLGLGLLTKVNVMASEPVLSSVSTSVSLIYSRRKDKKAECSTDCAKTSNVSVIKENIWVENVEITRLKDDPSRLEKMTVQELRKTMRSVGITAKGTKRDLLSALKCFLDEGNSLMTGDKPGSMETKEVKPKRNSKSKRKAEISSGVDCYLHSEVVQQVSIIPGKKSKGKRQPSFKVDSTSVEFEQESSISSNKVLGKAPNTNKPWTMLAHKKPQVGWVAYNPEIMRPPPLPNGTKHMKIMSWNVNGLRALLKLESFSALELAQKENFDVLCLQETKLQEKDVEMVKQNLIEGYDNSFWTCSVSKLGYSGTAIISRIKPLSVKYGLGILDHDSEGRLVTVEFDSFYLISGYVPNSGDGLKRLSYRIEEWDPSLSNYMKELEKSKPVILTGDLNCAHQEIDIYNPAGNRRSAGFTNEERESFGGNFLSKGFVDTFRKQHPGVVGYTYWGFRHGGRATNKGWRLDYFLVSESIEDKVHDSYIVPEVIGSDHCPIGLILKL